MKQQKYVKSIGKICTEMTRKKPSYYTSLYIKKVSNQDSILRVLKATNSKTLLQNIHTVIR
jgi:hypothetical protein